MNVCHWDAGAEIRHLCDEAALRAAQRQDGMIAVTAADFESALRVVRSSLTPDVLAQYEEWAAQLSR